MSQQSEALKMANRIRVEMADYKKQCKSGNVALHDAIQTCNYSMTLGSLLKSFPGIGQVKAERLCANAGLRSADVLMGGTSSHQNRIITADERQRLIDAIEGRRWTPRTQTPYLLAISAHEDEIFDRMRAAGCTATQIATVTGMSIKTVADRIWELRAA